jgi:hypothetical protein
VQHDKDERIRKRLEKERAVLVKDGTPSTKLRKVLMEIFALYSDADTGMQVEENEEWSLTSTQASRLWYRCGMKLASLDCILEAKVETRLDFSHFGF